jgi:hypothetical protein
MKIYNASEGFFYSRFKLFQWFIIDVGLGFYEFIPMDTFGINQK